MTDTFESEGQSPEKEKEIVDDNARKFVVGAIDSTFLKNTEASTFLMTTDWLEMVKENEKKIVRKKFLSGEVTILLIAKTTKDGKRSSQKQEIGEEKYKELLGASVRQVEKTRHEFDYAQGDIVFDIKYDEFSGSQLRILEVDASSEQARDSFDPNHFPAELSEVTGNIQYYGYMVADIV